MVLRRRERRRTGRKEWFFMFIWTARLRKKKTLLAVVLIAALVILLVILGGFLHKSAENGVGRLDTEESRADYLKDLGWEISPDPVATLQLQLPDPLTADYAAYNKLQKEQGFDLEDLKGRQVTRYTYTVLNYPGRPDGVQVNLYLCEGIPAAGDIIVTGADGFQAGLTFPE